MVRNAVVDKGSSSHMCVAHGDDEPKLLEQRSSPPPPRAERKRLSRQLRRSSIVVATIDDNGSSGGVEQRSSKNATGHDECGRVLLAHVAHGPFDEQDPAIEKHEMIGLARKLG